MVVKCEKIYSTVFEDKFYLTYSLSSIITDKSFELFKMNDLEELYTEYFNDSKIKLEDIDQSFQDFILNNSDYSKLEVIFYSHLKSIKRKYYMYLLIKDVYNKAELYQEFSFADIMNHQIFTYLFDSTEFTALSGHFMKKNDFLWSEIDEIFTKLKYKIKARSLLDKIEKSMIEFGILVKRLYMYYINQENETIKFQNEYKKFGMIIRDKQFMKTQNFTEIAIIAKKLSNETTVNWETINILIYKFQINKIKNKRMNFDKDKFGHLQYFSDILKQYKIYLKNFIKNNKNQVKKCDRNCLKICKISFENVKEYLNCAKEACFCKDYDIIVMDSVETNNEENLAIKLISYILVSFTSVLILIIMSDYIKNRFKFFSRNQNDFQYQILTENENEIKI